MIKLLINVFRKTIAHRGIPSGLLKSDYPDTRGHKITWSIDALAWKPALRLDREDGFLRKDPPWPVKYDHRALVHLGRLWQDLENAAIGPGATLRI